MNRKGKELICKLEGKALLNLESVQFYTAWNKKEKNQKIFTDEVNKIIV